MIVISSLAGATNAYREGRPARIVSLLSEDEAVPVFDGADAKAHLKLYVERESSGASITAAARSRAEELVKFIQEWNGEGGILIHCKRGVSRSTAAAFIVLCMRNPQADETGIARKLRVAAPWADPCPLLVSYADAILGRKGRMIEAIEDLPPPAPALEAPALALPL